MRSWSSSSMLLLLLAVFTISVAAGPVTVANASFETLPAGGLPAGCGGSCAFSTGPIPDWIDNGAGGQWITGGSAGNPDAIDGMVLGYTNGGTISQDVGAAVAGVTYTLQVEVLHRTDTPMAGVVQLEVGGVVVATATGTDLGPGTWSDWTAVYTALPGDAGSTVTILLSAGGAQGDFDNVRLDSSGVSGIPEPASTALIGIGFFGIAVLRRRLTR